MFTFKKLTYKSSTKPQQKKEVVSIPLQRLQAAPVVLPAEIWFMILDLVDYDSSACEHNTLCTLSLVSRVFNEFATKALYQTLNLSFRPCRKADGYVTIDYDSCMPCLEEDLLRRKLDRLEATLRLPQGPGRLIRHLILPSLSANHTNVQFWNLTRGGYLPICIYNYGKDIPRPKRSSFLQLDSVFRGNTNTAPQGILSRWLTIFELSSTNLKSVTHLGALWTFLYLCNHPDLRSRLCTAIEHNPHWTEWNWTEWDCQQRAREVFSHGALTIEPRLFSTFHGLRKIRSITVDNAELAVHVLGGIPAGQLEELKIHAKIPCDFRTLFLVVPITRLRSLSIHAHTSDTGLIEFNGPMSRRQPFRHLLEYLERSSRTLTHLDITWSYLGSPSYLDIPAFLSSLLNLAPALQILTLILNTTHESPILPPSTSTSTPVLAPLTSPNLHTLTLSLPSRNCKLSLASAISTGSFPALKRFTFRSAFSRETTTGFWRPCPAGPTELAEMLTWYDFARVQDRALVDACVAAGIREWEMQILNLPYVCFAFSIEERLEDDERSLYFRKPQVGGAGARTGRRRSGRVFESSYERNSRGTVCDIYEPGVGSVLVNRFSGCSGY